MAEAAPISTTPPDAAVTLQLLQSILTLSQSLHHGGGGGGGGGKNDSRTGATSKSTSSPSSSLSSLSLSLKQLVPVHASIIRATKVGIATTGTTTPGLVAPKPLSTTAATAATARRGDTNKEQEPSSSLSLQSALDASCIVESERALCESILIGATTTADATDSTDAADNDGDADNNHDHDHDHGHGHDDAAKLLVIQYLLDSVVNGQQQQHSTSIIVGGNAAAAKNPLPSLARVVLPLLLDTTTEPHCRVSDDLAEAVLHALFQDATATATTTVDESESESSQAWLQDCLQQCLAPTNSPTTSNDALAEEGIRQKRICRVLHRLFLWSCALTPTMTPTMTPMTEEEEDGSTPTPTTLAVVLNAITDKIIQGLEHCVAKPEDMAVTLRPVTNDLLPLIVDPRADGSHVERVWMCVWQCYGSVRQQEQEQQQGQEQGQEPKNANALVPSVLIVVTTVLCTILPSLLDRSLPGVTFVKGAVEAQAAARPLNQPAVWELILLCLNQGVHLPQKASWVEQSSKTQTTTVDESSASTQLLRRRGLYLLRIVTAEQKELLEWQKYVACFETLEMEFEPHLVDQVWETVAELCSQISKDQSAVSAVQVQVQAAVIPPPLSWSWMSVLLARVISSFDTPVLRKLGLYRLFKGQAGIIVDVAPAVAEVAEDDTTSAAAAYTKKKKTRSTVPKPMNQRGLPLRDVSTDFVLGVVVPSFDSLASSVGTAMHLEENRKVVREDMVPLLANFLDAYIQTMVDDPDKLEAFFRGLLSSDIICKLHRKTTVHIFSSIAENIKNRTNLSIPIQEETLKALVQSFRMLFALGSVVVSFRETLLQALATMLAHSQALGKVAPLTILSVLALYPSPVRPESDMQPGADKDDDSWIDQDPTLSALRQWLLRLGQGTPSWAKIVGSAVSTAFVDGLLLASPSSVKQAWDPVSGATDLERDTGKAVALFCTLAVGGTDKAAVSASELMWPAVHKGLARAPAAMVDSAWMKADCVTRALLILENGCKLQVLSGMGNGDLVVDRKTQQMMPPSQNIETMLSDGVGFIMRHIQALLTPKVASNAIVGGGSRSGDAKRVSSTFATLVSQLQTLHEGFPSSMAVSGAVDGLLKECIEALSSNHSITEENNVQRIALVYATLSSGGEILESDLLPTCEMILKLQFLKTSGDEQSGRSVFQYAKWGALSVLLPRLFNSSLADSSEVESFVNKVFDETSDAVEATPISALLPLFRCVVVAATGRFSPQADKSVVLDKENLQHLEKVVRALFSLMEECQNSADSMLMLSELSALLFQPHLLLDESTRLLEDADSLLPIRDAFRELMKLAERSRAHVSRAVLCRIASGWLGSEGKAGISAIPYRDDIADLLLSKEEVVDVSAANQSVGRGEKASGILEVPEGTHELSVARAFLLVFISELPATENGLHPRVLSDLLHGLIFRIIDNIRPSGVGIIMTGTAEFCRKMRGWQALCVLSRFVTSDVAERVCTAVFEALGEMLHGQIRYFIEIFALQCTRNHPIVFGNALVEQLTRQDLSLQQIASLMILGGNLIVGRYQLDFFRQYETEGEHTVRLNLVLSGVIPALSSTQGFSRSIAQLLVHKLIPLVVDIDSPPSGPGTEDSDWYLRSLYSFLDKNSEMKRLRKKQAQFFTHYEVDSVCTPEGVLSIPVDEGGEAVPLHLVDVIKDCLKEVYEEAHSNDTPTWKQMEDILNAEETDSNPLAEQDSDVVNFQRKIIPLDALNLALEELREKRLRNSAGRKKQELIVCATLVDKVPNLGGLARTAEIFAADRLVIPDLRVAKMDNFKSISVGAGDWIEIEECKEENLLSWLRCRKEEGYFIVGLEQTSSSVSLSDFEFPDRPTVLLLGKEKEGIPVEYLQEVELCLEIPQLGIIRSMNVHVSGAIAIWEHTRQKIAQGKLTSS